MERCSNCGAATRPGAKFCTSCGTRLNLDKDSAQPAAASWTPEASTQETQIATPSITRDDTACDTPHAVSETNDDATSFDTETDITGTSLTEKSTDASSDTAVEETAAAPSWASSWNTDTADESETADAVTESDLPTSRFADGLDGDGSESEESASESESPYTFPDRNTWTWGNASDEETDGTSQESETIALSSTTSEVTTVESGDTVIAAGSTVTGSIDAIDSDPRQRASTLVDELRGLIWKIGEDETSGSGDVSSIVSDLTSVRGETGDFSILSDLIAAVRDNPRDIDALRDLGRQADRMQALLDSHSRITGSLDDAIRKLRLVG